MKSLSALIWIVVLAALAAVGVWIGSTWDSSIGSTPSTPPRRVSIPPAPAAKPAPSRKTTPAAPGGGKTSNRIAAAGGNRGGGPSRDPLEPAGPKATSPKPSGPKAIPPKATAPKAAPPVTSPPKGAPPKAALPPPAAPPKAAPPGPAPPKTKPATTQPPKPARPQRTYAQRTSSYYAPPPRNLGQAPKITVIQFPHFPGAHASWGATGRDDRGHIWVGVSADDEMRGGAASAHLFEYIPQTDKLIDRGDVLTALKQNKVYRQGEQQSNIHTKIVQADDGYIYFGSLDTKGEGWDGTRLPRWGGHLWRLKPGVNRWEHLAATPHALLALSGVGRWIYALGYYDHVLYQYDTQTGKVRSVRVGAAGGHISRNFLSDARGHVYVPRYRPRKADETPDGKAPTKSHAPIAELVEYDAELREIAATHLPYYNTPGAKKPRQCQGIVGITYLADGSMVFITHWGRLRRIVPSEKGPARVEDLGWFFPNNPSYAPSLFTFAGTRYLVGTCRSRIYTHEWIVYDMKTRSSVTAPFRLSVVGQRSGSMLIYGSQTRDNQGRCYMGGRLHGTRRGDIPVLVKLEFK